MAAPLTIYGYEIHIPEDDSSDFIRDMCSINDTLVEPIQVYCMTPQLAMLSVEEVQVIIGFIPDSDLSRNIIHLDALREFIMDNPMFDGVDMNEKPAFYAGFEWKDDILSEASETSLHSSDCDSTDDSEDCSTSEVSEDYASSDEDLSDDEHEKKEKEDDESISYYVSNYYI